MGMRTLQLIDGTVLVVRQIAAVGPIVHKEKIIEGEDDEIDPLPPKCWSEFHIVLVGGTKLYPTIEYNIDDVQANRDRNKVVAALETKINEL